MDVSMTPVWRRATRLVPALLAAAVVLAACGRSGDLELNTGIFVQTQVVDATANVGFYADLEIDPVDLQPSISYYDFTNGNLKFAKLNAQTGEWELTVVEEENDVGGFSDMEYSQTGNPHIAYYDFTNLQARYAVRNELGEWERSNIPFAGQLEGFLAMALDINDVAHMPVISAGRFNLEYLVYDFVSDTLFGTTVDDGTLTTTRGGNINLKVDVVLREVNGEQLPVIAYYQASHGLLQLAWLTEDPDGTLRFEYRIIDGSFAIADPDVGLFASIWLEPARGGENPHGDWLHISYYDATNQDLLYARYDWERDEVIRERVDTSGIVGETSSITVFGEEAPCSVDEQTQEPVANRRPAITYFDSTNNDLKLAFRTDDGRWFLRRVDLRGVVGSFSSVRPLADCSLGVAYRDTQREALKFSVVRVN